MISAWRTDLWWPLSLPLPLSHDERSSSSAAGGEVNGPQLRTRTLSADSVVGGWRWWGSTRNETHYETHRHSSWKHSGQANATTARRFDTTRRSPSVFAHSSLRGEEQTSWLRPGGTERPLFDTTYQDQTPNTSTSMHSIFFLMHNNGDSHNPE